MLDQMESRDGSKSGIIRQLNALMQENPQAMARIQSVVQNKNALSSQSSYKPNGGARKSKIIAKKQGAV